MLVLGHAGITLGIAALLSSALSGSHSLPTKTNGETQCLGESVEPYYRQNSSVTRRPSWITFLAIHIDIRVLLIGSLLPDIIDKPIGLLFFSETLSSGRIFCHTLLFLILSVIAGLYLYRSRGVNHGLTISFGILTHLIFDQVWRYPRTLFWPIYGLTFDRIEVAEWMPNILRALISDPATYLPELVGAAVLVWFILSLMLRQKVFHFLKSGQVE